VEHVWDINDVIPEKSTVGRFLTAVVGYNGNPSLIEVVAYVVFLVSVLLAYIRAIGTRKPVGAVAGT
jgi:high-affinity iron transporter